MSLPQIGARNAEASAGSAKTPADRENPILKQLMDMGFDKEDAAGAAASCKDIQEALAKLGMDVYDDDSE